MQSVGMFTTNTLIWNKVNLVLVKKINKRHSDFIPGSPKQQHLQKAEAGTMDELKAEFGVDKGPTSVPTDVIG